MRNVYEGAVVLLILVILGAGYHSDDICGIDKCRELIKLFLREKGSAVKKRVGKQVSAAPPAAGRKQENCRNENRKEESRSFCGMLFYFCFQLCTSFSHGFLK